MNFPSKDKLINIESAFNNAQYLDVLKQANDLIKIYPNHKSGWNALGAVLMKMGEKKKALNIYINAVKLIPEDFDIFNNLGKVQQQLGHFNDSENSFKKALELNFDNFHTHFNLGNTLYHLKKKNEAAEYLENATKIKPNDFYAKVNLGVVFMELHKYEKAKNIFQKALKIDSKNKQIHNYLGTALLELGDIEESIIHYTNAIDLDNNYIEAWNNVYYSIHASKYLKPYEKEKINTILNKKIRNLNNIPLHILNLKLNSESIEFFNFLKKNLYICNKNNKLIKNTCTKLAKKEYKNKYYKNDIINLLHFGRSGTGLLHSLLDNHPEISTLPGIYLSEYFDTSIWENIINLGFDKMVDAFINIYEVLFDSRSSKPVPSINKGFIKNIGVTEGMTKLGKYKDEFLYVDKTLFKKELEDLMSSFEYLDQLTFFNLIHTAYEKASKQNEKKSKIFYHIHNPDINANINYLRLAPNSKWIIMIRNPMESLESWILNYFNEGNYSKIVVNIKTMLFGVNSIFLHDVNAVGVRLEDLKENPKDTLSELCKWMGIKNNKSLYSMTAQGKIWWGDESSTNTEAFGKINKSKIGKVFSEKDRYILQTLFYPFSERFGYVKKDIKKFKSDLKIIYPLMQEMFDFEKELAKSMKLKHKSFIKLGYYKYLRVILKERWSLLNENYTYFNMIKPLPLPSNLTKAVK